MKLILFKIETDDSYHPQHYGTKASRKSMMIAKT